MDVNVVYWSHPLAEHHLKFQNILNNVKHFNVPNTEPNASKINFIKCPFFNSFARKTFNILAPFDYSLISENGELKSFHYDQNFFNNNIFVRSNELKLFSFGIMSFLFFTKQNCILTCDKSYFSNNDFSISTHVIPGQLNISKWFRAIDLAFIIKNNNQLINIKKGDPLFSVNFNFNNNNKIIFKRFKFTDKLRYYSDYKKVMNPLIKPKLNQLTDFFYESFDNSGIGKIILKEIDNNLME